ncbi:oligosaccharide flippase family protein [Modicisalibacter radicis]|uniref:oligosaccharide flippase family protein n=1 Tax=Halomonas sp. EAR18 TaxID=2518972 RepID=UPI00109C4E86|nr:oligosaccharide flippase family protein [Halomonas sp. EAR18]
MRVANLFSRVLGGETHQLIRGLAYFGSAEALTRIVRIAVIVVIARQVSPQIMGLAALVLSIFEMVRVLANAGIGQRIIAESDEALQATCNTAHRLFWGWCLVVAAIQASVAGVLLLCGMADIAAMLLVLSGVYCFMPGGLVQVFLLMRERRFAVIATIGAAQTICDHLLTLVLVLVWPSAWAIVLPKLITAPLWLILVRRARFWKPDESAGYTPWRDFTGFAFGVLASEMVAVARAQLDKVVVGWLFGVQALGIYYFAFNAGLGITTSFIMALGQVLFPYLCAVKQPRERLRRCWLGLLAGILIFLPLLAFQVGMASWYVPLVFGEQWVEAAPLVAILALGGIPMIFAACASAWWRADNRPVSEAVCNSIATGLALGALVVFSPFGLEASALGYVGGMALVFIPVVLWCLLTAGKAVDTVLAREVLA